ncbi:TPA: hypothetical protein MFL73_004892 [Klebsiella pneumoniae]|nr:hypothetical protein [Klebsiella pneumoniae]HBW8432176.1 hypothetical protein [Klebsiella pneumoniae]HBW8437228.1 hypothetical protein [Klebsiella pneumoniae]HBW8651717.1 hypothetical protein [Klebsiella pneumoniae]HBW8678489.1 hypothetical protein [Klebsiella pneumoniae]
MGSCAAPSAKGDDKFITTDYLQQCRTGYTYPLNEQEPHARLSSGPESMTIHHGRL